LRGCLVEMGWHYAARSPSRALAALAP
jgi:hypothetical protein